MLCATVCLVASSGRISPLHRASVHVGSHWKVCVTSEQLVLVCCCMSAGTWAAYVNEETDYTKWTVLREGDGGRHVHELHIALEQQGFWAGEDDMLWWQFGSDTCSAVQTFQVFASITCGVSCWPFWQCMSRRSRWFCML